MGARERGSGTAVFGVTHITERSPGAQLQSAICNLHATGVRTV